MNFDKNKIIAFVIISIVMVVFFPMAFFNMDPGSNIKGLLSFLGVIFGVLAAIIIGSSNSTQSH